MSMLKPGTLCLTVRAKYAINNGRQVVVTGLSRDPEYCYKVSIVGATPFTVCAISGGNSSDAPHFGAVWHADARPDQLVPIGRIDDQARSRGIGEKVTQDAKTAEHA